MTTEHDYTSLDAAIAALGLTLTAEFVPQSRSRNAGEKQPSLNWKVTIARGSRTLGPLDYMQGIGHLPKLPERIRNLRMAQDYEHKAAEAGRLGRYSGGFIQLTQQPIPPPTLREFLYCVVADASVLDSGGFEDWAREFGYDTDSRSAEATYRACLEQSLAFRALIGDDGLRSLQQAYSDANY